MDIRTLFATHTVVLFCLAAALSFISLTQNTYPGFKRWTLGIVAMALGYLLSLLRGPIPPAVSILAGNTLFVVGSALTLAGILRFLGRGPWLKFQVAVALSCLAGLAWFLWGEDQIAMRVMVLSLAVTALLLPAAWLLLTYPAEGHRPVYLATGVVFALFCAALMTRAVAMAGVSSGFDLFAQSPSQGAFFLFLMGSQVSWTIGLLLINSQRLSDELNLSRSQLMAAAETQREILDFLPDPCWVVDRQGRVTHWNQAMERLTGVAASQVLGKGNYQHALPLYDERRPCLIDLVLQRSPEWERRFRDQEERGGSLTFQESSHPKLREGGAYLAEAATALFDGQGRVSGAIETLRDITEARRSQQEREELIGELTDALDKVKTLKGLIPICSHCKSIRRDEGYWEQLEAYISQHADVEFSHGICPDCIKKYYQGWGEPPDRGQGKRGRPDGSGKRDHPDDVG